MNTITNNTTCMNNTVNPTCTLNSTVSKTNSLLDIDFVKEVMSVPTCSKYEIRMVKWIEAWADERGIRHERDAAGNLYLTKGELAEGEFYPGLTSHLDTVQRQQMLYAMQNVPLNIVCEATPEGHVLSCEGFGIGADCKSGIAICLAIIDHLEKGKCLFFVREEEGCVGSRNMDLSQLANVGYVLGFDSPELQRAAWASNGTSLFTLEFYRKYLMDVCNKHGLEHGHFHSEPLTDVKVLREATGLACTNFGNGGYFCHCPNEYCVVEHMDHAAQMGLELAQTIGNQRPVCPLDKGLTYHQWLVDMNSL